MFVVPVVISVASFALLQYLGASQRDYEERLASLDYLGRGQRRVDPWGVTP